MPNDDDLIGQNEIDALLRQAQAGPGTKPQATTPAEKPVSQDDVEALFHQGKPDAAVGGSPASNLGQQDVEMLLQQAQEALAAANSPAEPSVLAGLTPFRLEDFSHVAGTGNSGTLELIREVELDLRIELGRTEMYLEDVLKLHKGSVVPLDKLAGDPVDIYVNGRPIARGEILVLNDNFCVRVTELVAAEPAKAG